MTRQKGKKHQRPHGAHKKSQSGKEWQSIADSWPDLDLKSEIDPVGTPPKPLRAATRMRKHGGGESV